MLTAFCPAPFLTGLILMACNPPVPAGSDMEMVQVDAVPGHALTVLDSSHFLRSSFTSMPGHFLQGSEIMEVQAYAHPSPYGVEDKVTAPDGRTYEQGSPLVLTDAVRIGRWKGIDPQPHALDIDHRQELLAILNDTANFQPGEAGCFYPRHTFLFIGDQKLVIGRVSLCFECHMIRTDPDCPECRDGGLSDQGMQRFSDLLQAAGIHRYPERPWEE